ncbi:preprotein translocase subunit YajC [Nitrospira sp.]|nr:preprotein translocase subunit YajC [Nitrospira sp.]
MTLLTSLAWAQAGGSGQSSPNLVLSLVPFLLIFAIFYFLLILPQQKKQKELRQMLEGLKKGDKIVTASGIWGTVTNMGKQTVTLQISDTAKIKIQREHIARIRTEDDE